MDDEGCRGILADSNALIALGAIDSEIQDLVWGSVDITVTRIVFHELRDKARNHDDPAQKQHASSTYRRIDTSELEPYPGDYSAGEKDAGEKEMRTALRKDSYKTVITYDSRAIDLFMRTREDISGSFTIEPPNFPLVVLYRNSIVSSEDVKIQTENMIERCDWDGSADKDLFYDYPVFD